MSLDSHEGKKCMGCPYIYEDWILPDMLAGGVNMVSGSLYVWGKHLDLCKENKPYMDAEAGVPEGLHHSRSEGACCSPARLPCHHKTFLVSFPWDALKSESLQMKIRPPSGCTFPACSSSPCFRLGRALRHMRSSCQVLGGQLGSVSNLPTSASS